MEREIVRLQVTSTKMSKLPPTLGFKSAVSINIDEVMEEFIEDESGTTHVASHPASVSRFLLKPRCFTPRNLCGLLRRELNRETPFCGYVAEQIAFCRFSRANHTLYQRPFLMSVNVKVVREVRFILPFVSVPLSNGASGDGYQRLIEEQSVESNDLDDDCSICMDKLSDSSSENHGHVIQMPSCLLMFHQSCIFEWFAHHNSCPLCRRVPYEEED